MKKIVILLLALSLLLSPGCGTIMSKIPMPIKGYEAPPLYSFPGIQFDLAAISEGGFYLIILDLPFSFVGDIFFILLSPIEWLLHLGNPHPHSGDR